MIVNFSMSIRNTKEVVADEEDLFECFVGDWSDISAEDIRDSRHGK